MPEVAETPVATTPASDATTQQAPVPATTPAPDTQPSLLSTEDTNKGEVQTDNKDAKPAEGAPEKYDFKLPEGIEMDSVALAKFEPIARGLNLSQGKAQEMVDLFIDVQSQQAKHHQEAFAKQIEGWATEVRNDPEIGGHNLEASIKSARAAVNKYASDELKSVLAQTGLDKHPAMIKAFAAIGKPLVEDSMHPATQPTSPQGQAKILFPDMN